MGKQFRSYSAINMTPEMSYSKVHERESKCKGGSALKCSSTQHVEQHCPGGTFILVLISSIKATENYIDRVGILTDRKCKSSKSSYTSSSITLQELSLRLLEIHTVHIYKHRPFYITNSY